MRFTIKARLAAAEPQLTALRGEVQALEQALRSSGETARLAMDEAGAVMRIGACYGDGIFS